MVKKMLIAMIVVGISFIASDADAMRRRRGASPARPRLTGGHGVAAASNPLGRLAGQAGQDRSIDEAYAAFDLSDPAVVRYMLDNKLLPQALVFVDDAGAIQLIKRGVDSEVPGEAMVVRRMQQARIEGDASEAGGLCGWLKQVLSHIVECCRRPHD